MPVSASRSSNFRLACQFDPTGCGPREGFGSEACAPLVILACVCLDRESAATEQPFCRLIFSLVCPEEYQASTPFCSTKQRFWYAAFIMPPFF